MSELLLGVGATIGGTILGWYLGVKSERQSQQREIIFELYRPLIEDLRASIINIRSEFRTGLGFITRHFNTFQKYFRDSTMKAIEGYDPTLYRELEKIRDEVLPFIKKVDDSKDDSFKRIQNKWISILETKNTDMNIEQFVSFFFSSSIGHIWRGDVEKAKEDYDQRLSDLKSRVSTTELPPSSTFQELIDGANEEFSSVRNLFPQLEEKFSDIDSNVIARMDNTIKSQFEK